MTRSSQLLHPQRQPVDTLKASTVLLLRDCAGGPGLEVLMTRRSARASFVPSAYVFPGGGIEAQDAAETAHACASTRPAQAADALRITQAIAGLRETFEELGILLAYDALGRPVSAAELATLDRKAPLVPQCEARGLRLAVDALWYLAHWTADRDQPRRFDVPFFVARMPEDQEPDADGSEQFEPIWVRPQEALERHHAGGFPMIFPTIRTLDRLSRFADTDAVFAALTGEQPLWKCCPRTGFLDGKEARHMEDEAPFGELEMVCPDGQILHTLDWQSERAVPLRKNLLRLTAPNPGVMTGPGTNSYLVGDASTGYAAIDPGPADAGHVQRLFDAAGGDIRHILCTHSHADHSPGAALLQALAVQAGRPRPAIGGLPSAPTARPASRFTPDYALADGQRIVLHDAPGGTTHTLVAVFTPGHAANHVCFLLEEDALLFSGDHILNGSTTIIDPPDGNMRDYIDSLDKLDALCATHGAQFILPAHGYVLGFARQAIARLKAHRLAREAKVLAAMRQLPDGSVQDWVRLAYDDAPSRLWPIAERSLLAHVERIRALCTRQ
ncbi:hydroxyacylglutathione hydrolase [Delftia tsuruhatensis]|uniref:MBL fold metallo-hydrolase n=1 Tax=Delftia tsuruhatensis TaxID=180282 RepID=UPI001E7BCBCC|nr:MBL fold metallo-hydrolase [Delftia tsuruhatensis]CAB5723295.1 hydroxyacylglutathione hydrolase [Delftia tsuruhatensis]CAC9691650.1 hydroxyacylglutathione hydrolase [Delftia tsuruhatensis]